MTPARARQLGHRWLAVGFVALVARTVLAEIGIDELDLPILVGMWLAFIQAVGHFEWAKGYEDRDKATAPRENA